MKRHVCSCCILTVLLTLGEHTLADAGSFVPTGSLANRRSAHTTTVLSDGKILTAGGYYYPGTFIFLSSTEIFDPSIGRWSGTGALSDARAYHSASLLSNGKVLVAGGQDDNGTTNLAELYDPASGTWTVTGSLNAARKSHTATLLLNGKVLVTGGENNVGVTNGAELYDPSLGTWTITGSMAAAREYHTATLLPDGKVLVAGGWGGSSAVSSAEIYDPVTGSWSPTGAMNNNRQDHTATLLSNGKVLVAGGDYFSGGFHVNTAAELYDPATGVWTPTGPMASERYGHSATLLPTGTVLVAGGVDSSGNFSSSAELYNPLSATWLAAGPMSYLREYHTAALMTNGMVLMVGGTTYGSWNYGETASAEIYYDAATPSWTVAGETITLRYNGHQAVPLANGKVLVMAGTDRFSNPISTAELYDPTTGTWIATGSMTNARSGGFSATLLANGKVLVAGGYDNSYLSTFSVCELYDPATGLWSSTGAMNEPRFNHTATLLPNGKVLVAGGHKYVPDTTLSSAELYDPATGTWTGTSSLPGPREGHSTILLPSGNVLVAGGGDGSGIVSSVVLYNPAAGTWTPTGLLNPARSGCVLTVLTNGQVIAVGGGITNVDVYNPTTGTWLPAGGMNVGRAGHTATVLASGKVMVAGGVADAAGDLASVELYDPVTGSSSFTDGMQRSRVGHTATLLSNNKVLVVAGATASGYGPLALRPSAELYVITNYVPNHAPVLGPLIPDQTNIYGAAFNYTFPPTTFSDPDAGQLLSYSATGLPPGITFDGPTRTFSGTNTSPGAFPVTVTATDNGSPPLSTNAVFDFVVVDCSALAITNATLPNAVRGSAYSVMLAATNGSAPYTFAITSGTLPANLALAANGLLSGTPTNTGNYSITVSVTSSVGCLAASNYLLSVVCPAITVLPATLPEGNRNYAYNQTITASGGSAPYSFGLTSGVLPPGLALSSAGSLSGTPTTGGVYTFTITATDAGGCTGDQLYTITIPLPVYEGFAYSPGTPLNGQNGGTGFSNAWSGASGFGIFEGSFFTGVPSSGNHLFLAGDGMISRRLSQTIGTAGTVRYLSVAEKVFYPLIFGPPPGADRVGLMINGTTGAGLFFGKPNAANNFNWVFENAAGGDQVVGPAMFSVVPSTQVLLVVKCEFFAGNDRFTLYVNPTPGQPEPASGTVKFDSDLGSVTNIAFTASSLEGDWHFDEIRLAATFAEAVPVVPSMIVLENETQLPNGAFQFSFTNTPAVPFTALASTNPALPLSNWTTLGPVTEGPAGQFQFTDPQATNNQRCFYRVRSP